MAKNKSKLLDEIIKLSKRSEKKYREGDFKGAIEDKLKANNLYNQETFEEELIEQYKQEISLLYQSKFDLIYDHKLRIDNKKKESIIKLLLRKTEEKYKKGDFKGAIKALRRSEKYI